MSSKASLKNEEEPLMKDLQFEPFIENESLFQNKKLEELMALRKRKSEVLLMEEPFMGENW